MVVSDSVGIKIDEIKAPRDIGRRAHESKSRQLNLRSVTFWEMGDGKWEMGNGK